MPKTKQVYRKTLEKKRLQKRKLVEESEKYIQAILHRFRDVSRDQLFDPKVKTRRPTAARQLVFAFLFHVVLSKHNRRLVAQHLGFSVATVSEGLKTVSRAVRSKWQSLIKLQAIDICRDLELRTGRLTFKGIHLGRHATKKRSRR